MGVVLLFTPPFDHSTPHPGYIQGYSARRPRDWRVSTRTVRYGSPRPVRGKTMERGAVALLQIMNPVERSRSPQAAHIYKGEPYVVAADVSAAEGAGRNQRLDLVHRFLAWMYRIWLEDVLGFQLHGTELQLDPAIPANWPGFEIRYRFRKTPYIIRVERGRVAAALLDGKPLRERRFPLKDDGREHTIQVILPPTEAVQEITRSDAEPTEASNVLEALR